MLISTIGVVLGFTAMSVFGWQGFVCLLVGMAWGLFVGLRERD